MNQIETEQKTSENTDSILLKQRSDKNKKNERLLHKIDLLTADLIKIKSENEDLKLEKISNDENKERFNILEDIRGSYKS